MTVDAYVDTSTHIPNISIMHSSTIAETIGKCMYVRTYVLFVSAHASRQIHYLEKLRMHASSVSNTHLVGHSLVKLECEPRTATPGEQSCISPCSAPALQCIRTLQRKAQRWRQCQWVRESGSLPGASAGQCQRPGGEGQRENKSTYSTLHYTTLHYTTLHYTTLHYSTYNAVSYSVNK